MNTIVYNINSSQLNQAYEAVSLKAGYLLADMSISAGTLDFDLLLTNNISSLNLKRKIHFLDNIIKDLEGRKTIEQAWEIFHIHNKTKHKSQAQIVALKKIERTITTACEESIANVLEIFRRTGLAVIDELRDPRSFAFYDVPADGETEAGNDIPTSVLLQLENMGENDYCNLFFLPPEFFEDDFKDMLKLYQNNNEEPNPHFYLHKCFSLPNINFLHSSELTFIRNQLQSAGSAFKTATDEWMKLCFQNEDIQVRKEYFSNKILHAAAALQEAIQQNKLLAHCCSVQNNSVAIEILVGEIPVHLIWDFFNQFGAIRPATWNKLQKLKEEDLPACKSWPVFIFRKREEMPLAVADTDAEERLLPLKKYISVD